jgi:hypothetical protein
VSSPLAGIALEKRRRFAAALALLATLFVAVGVVASTGDAPGIVRLFSAILLIVAVLLGSIAWGVAHSVKIDLADARLDNAIEAAVAAHGVTCGCARVHDVDEMHVSDESGTHHACPVSGTECTRGCDTCALGALRPSPTQARSEQQP